MGRGVRRVRAWISLRLQSMHVKQTQTNKPVAVDCAPLPPAYSAASTHCSCPVVVWPVPPLSALVYPPDKAAAEGVHALHHLIPRLEGNTAGGVGAGRAVRRLLAYLQIIHYLNQIKLSWSFCRMNEWTSLPGRHNWEVSCLLTWSQQANWHRPLWETIYGNWSFDLVIFHKKAMGHLMTGK